MPGPHGVPRAEIVALLQQGHSDRYIGRTLHTNPKRVSRIRTELGIPRPVRKPTLTLHQTWAAYTKPTHDGHLTWTGYHREGTCPVLKYRGGDYTARRIAFVIAQRREPIGRVLAGCGLRECVAPAHMEDAQMRAQFDAIFGAAA
jgi:hypothetical protein